MSLNICLEYWVENSMEFIGWTITTSKIIKLRADLGLYLEIPRSNYKYLGVILEWADPNPIGRKKIS